jgi:hypothetical protein
MIYINLEIYSPTSIVLLNIHIVKGKYMIAIDFYEHYRTHE